MTDDLDVRMRSLAADQHGVLEVAQLKALGLTEATIRHRVRIGVVEPLSHRVFRLAGSTPTVKQELTAALLDAGAGAAISRESAAALWGLPGFTPNRPQVTRPRSGSRRRPALGDVHETGRFPPHHRTTSDGIAVTSVPRTLFDLAGTAGFSEARLERAVDNALALSPAVLARLHNMVAELARRGRPGIAVMRELLEARPAGYVAPASGLEARVIALLDEAGVATRRQVDLGGEHWIGRVDLRVDGAPVVVECDSALHHSSNSDRQRDRRRDADLGRLGLTVVRITEDEAFHRPWLVAPKVRAAVLAPESVALATDSAPSSPGGGAQREAPGRTR